ncbi:hypothetical protein RDI58_004534 [Solanum bulbocastanum]|uniref:DUF4283 domain-containing protein n=1 Tax=Solanum bulbocastanum TaxID=147425 RepID=A0AAN8TXT1_SOLBU
MAASPSPQPMVVGEKNDNPNTGRTYVSSISENQQYTKKSLKPVSLLHGEPTLVFDSKDLETFITEENLKYALIDKFSYGRPELLDLRKILPQQLGFKGECMSIKFADTVIPFRIQKWTPSFSPREETSIAMAWISFPSLPCQYFTHNALFSMASTVRQPLDMDRATNDKTRPSTAKVKVEVDLLRTLPKRIRVQLKNLVTNKITNGKNSCMIIYHIIVKDVNIKGIEKLIVELLLMVNSMPRSVKIILMYKNFKEICVFISMLKRLIQIGWKSVKRMMKEQLNI